MMAPTLSPLARSSVAQLPATHNTWLLVCSACALTTLLWVWAPAMVSIQRDAAMLSATSVQFGRDSMLSMPQLNSLRGLSALQPGARRHSAARLMAQFEQQQLAATSASDTFKLYSIADWNLTYCHVPNVAPASMNTLLARLLDPSAQLAESPKVRASFDSNPHVQAAEDLWPQTVRQLLASPSISRFIVVREPTERFVNAFLQECTARHQATGACPKLPGTNYAGWSQAKIVDAVLNVLEARPPQSANAHWRSLQYFCGLSQHKDQYSIIRLEQLREGLDALAKELHVNETQRAVFRDAVAEITAEIASPHSTATEFPDWLTPERQARIQRYYAADYELLGYPLPLPDAR